MKGFNKYLHNTYLNYIIYIQRINNNWFWLCVTPLHPIKWWINMLKLRIILNHNLFLFHKKNPPLKPTSEFKILTQIVSMCRQMETSHQCQKGRHIVFNGKHGQEEEMHLLNSKLINVGLLWYFHIKRAGYRSLRLIKSLSLKWFNFFKTAPLDFRSVRFSYFFTPLGH